MAEDMGMYLEEIIKKTNPQEYIKILEKDRQDFAEEINRLQEKIDKTIEILENIPQIPNNYLELKRNDLLEVLKGE